IGRGSSMGGVAMTPLSRDQHRLATSHAFPATPLSSTLSTTSSFVNRLGTPLRDQLGINASIRQAEPLDVGTMFDAYHRSRLVEALKNLPTPKNDFEIALSDEE